MRRRPAPRASRLLPALAVALGVHLLIVPPVLRFIASPPRHKLHLAEKAPDKPAPGQDQSVEAEFLTQAELEKLLGPTPPAQAAAPEAPPAPPTEPPAPATKPPDERPHGQIVSIPPPPREEIPENARFLSEYNSRAEREQVSELNAVPQPEMRRGNTVVVSGGDDENGNTTDPHQATKDKEKQSRTQAPEKRPGDGDAVAEPSKDRGVPEPAQKAVAGKSTPESDSVVDPYGTAARTEPSEGERRAQVEILHGGAGSAGGAPAPRSYKSLLPTIGPQDLARQEGNIDDMPDDVESGHGTFLNTRAFKHAWFFNRLKEEIYEHWNVVGVYRRHDPYGRVYGVRDRVTILRIELKTDGSLRDVFVLQNSGAAFLDDVAVQAVREAQPFPNPPGGLADDDGIIRITYRFTLDIESGGFRLF